MPKKQYPKASRDLRTLSDEMADFDADMERDEALDRPGRTSPFVSDDRDLELVRQWLAPRKGVRQWPSPPSSLPSVLVLG
jgi:hypothetical protein